VPQRWVAFDQVEDVVPGAPAQLQATARQLMLDEQSQHPSVEVGGGLDVRHGESDVRHRSLAQGARRIAFGQDHAGWLFHLSWPS